jgi:hypothetical protein
VGQTVEVAGRNNVFSPAPTSWRYQWLRNGNPIPNATGRTYTIRNADAGAELSVRVTARRNGFANRTLTLDSIQVEQGPIRFGQQTLVTAWQPDLQYTFRAPVNVSNELRAVGGTDWFEPMPGNAFWVMEADVFNPRTTNVRLTSSRILGFQPRTGPVSINPCPPQFARMYYGTNPNWVPGRGRVDPDFTAPVRTSTRFFMCVEAPANALTSGQFGLRSNNAFVRWFATP